MNDIKAKYKKRYYGALCSISDNLSKLLESYLGDAERIDLISVRPKAIKKFVSKAKKVTSDGSKKYTDPLNEIQDQIGARIVTFYLSDIDRISKIIDTYFQPIEEKRIVPDSEWKFGYFGKHYILHMPNEIKRSVSDESLVPDFFELQVKTLFQHAWSEAEHDLAYKPELGELSERDTRELAFTSAQAWGADKIFDELLQRKLANK